MKHVPLCTADSPDDFPSGNSRFSDNHLFDKGVDILILVDPFLELGSGECELAIAVLNVSDDDWSNFKDL